MIRIRKGVESLFAVNETQGKIESGFSVDFANHFRFTGKSSVRQLLRLSSSMLPLPSGLPNHDRST